MLSENFFPMFLFFRIKKYLLGGDCRHSLTLQACKFLMHRARKTLWQYAASKRMHFFIHRFIYVHITLRAGIIQIYQIQEMGHKSGFVLLFRDLGDIWYCINLSSSFSFFVKRHAFANIAQTAFTLTASVNCASIRRGGENINSTSKGFFFDELFLLVHPKILIASYFH